MLRRTWIALPALVGALAIVGACADSPVAPAAATDVVFMDRVAVAAFPDTTHFMRMSGELWVCARGNQPGRDFHYIYMVTDKATQAIVAKGAIRGLNIGECALATTVPTDARGHYQAVVKQDAPKPFALAHGFFNCGSFFPASPPLSTVDLAKRTLTSSLSNDWGMVMTFYNHGPLREDR